MKKHRTALALVAHPSGGQQPTYTDTQWQAIRVSLAAVNVDLDTATVSYALRGNPPLVERPLRETLQGLAMHFTVEAGTVRDLTSQSTRGIAQLRANLAALKAPLAVFDDAEQNEFFLTMLAGLDDTTARHKSCYDAAIALRVANHDAAELTGSITRLQQRLDQLAEWRGANARKVHGEFWIELIRVWRALTPKRQYKILSWFLFACSAPVFPDEMADGADGALTAFIERHFPQMNS